MPGTDIVIRLAGTAGEGALSLGELLARSLAKLGWELMLHFSFEAEVRGEKPSFSQVRVSDTKPISQGGAVDLLVALNKDALTLNLPELKPGGAVVYDGRPIDAFKGPVEFVPALPENVKGFPVPFEVISSDIGFPAAKNMAALGALSRLLGIPPDMLSALVASKFKKKGETVTGHNITALEKGMEHIGDADAFHRFGERGTPKLMLSGN